MALAEAEMAYTIEIPGVEILAEGTWDTSTGKTTVTTEHLDQVLEAFGASEGQLRVPIRLGHWADESEPAQGWVENLRRAGAKLVADLVQVPVELGQAIKAGRYGPRSAGLREDFRIGETVWPLALEHLALLGAVTPAVSGLNDIAALFSSAPPAAPVLLGSAVEQPPTTHTPDASSGTNPKEHVMEENLRELLGLAPDGDPVEAVKALMAKAEDAESKSVELSRKAGEMTELRKQVVELSAKDAKRDAEDLVGEFKDRIAPASREQAVAFALQDPKVAREFFSAQPKFVETKEHGSSGDGAGDFGALEPSDAQVSVFSAMNGGRFTDKDRVSLMRKNAERTGVSLPDNFDALARRN